MCSVKDFCGKRTASETVHFSSKRSMAYRYTPLDINTQEIRLLILQPAVENEPIECSLQHVSIESEPRPMYETTSYVWGDSSLRDSIRIDGKLSDVPISCKEVLLRLRLPKQLRTLWIDAVCINQSDTVERSQQVGIMNHIYARSSGNLIWLGEDRSYARSAIESVRNILADLATRTNDFQELAEAVYDSHGNFRHLDVTSDVLLDQQALLALFHCAWFSRVW